MRDFPNNLPQHVTTFVGRTKEVGEVKKLLEKDRLVTLSGSGGIGKTRLALQVADDLLEQFPDRVWHVPMTSLADAALVRQTLAQLLDVCEEPGKPLARSLTETLRAKRLLLVLDNCEIMRDAAASLISDVLLACPSVRILATSREPFNIAGEQIYPVPSLSLPAAQAAQTAEGLNHYEAARLFIERARLARPDFVVTDANAPAIAQLCLRLDGSPLAIELAAARLRSLTVEQIATRLEDRFREMYVTGGTLPQDAPSYVTRSADTDLRDSLLAGEYCYVLNSRQMGKSSLCVRTI